MKMNKMFAGLIAFVAGVALSAGSAFATKGYTIGDPAGMKLVPFYETGGTLFTAIGIQNLSAQTAAIMALNQDVDDLTAYLGGGDPGADGSAMFDNLETLLDPSPTAETALVMTDLNAVDRVEKALETAKMAVKTEHLVVNVMVYDHEGMMMAKTALCMAEDQFGYVVITESGDAMSIDNRGMVLSMMDDEISAYGYVTVAAGSKFTGCSFGAENVTRVTYTANDGTVDTANSGGTAEIATWTILQDVGTGFYGTEIPSSTITMGTDADGTTAVDESTMVSCYGDPATATNAVGGAATGEFNTATHRCSLIPERHNNTRTDGALVNPSSVASTVTVRFDVIEDTENDIFVWLAAGGDTNMTAYADRRKLMVTTYCEDGTMSMVPDMTPGAAEGAMMSTAEILAPTMLTMIDPMGEVLMPYTEQCLDAGGRGVLKFMMPNKSYAGMAWTHISQRMSNFRMNMPGYNMGAPEALDADGLTAANAR